MIDGLRVIDLAPRTDDRGELAEVFRAEWLPAVEPIQWNVVHDRPGVLRGVHCHIRHDDYLLLASGCASIGLQDLRRNSPTFGDATVVDLEARRRALVIPHGVAHGFWFPSEAIHIYAVSHYWDTADELRCRWDDPDLSIPWNLEDPLLSTLDEKAGSLAEMLEALERGADHSIGEADAGEGPTS